MQLLLLALDSVMMVPPSQWFQRSSVDPRALLGPMMHNGLHTAVVLHTSLTNRPGHHATCRTSGRTAKPDAVLCWHLRCTQATASVDKQWKAAQEAPQGSFNNRLFRCMSLQQCGMKMPRH